MSLLPEPPFLEGESRFFLAEILKTSDVQPAELVKIIRDRDIRPRWEQMHLPHGRSIASCKHQYDMLTNRLSSIISTSGQVDLPPMNAPQSSRVQRMQGFPATDAPAPPQQYQFAPINEPSNPSAFHPVPLIHTEPLDKSGKKRGRPSKAERELREAEARARGEVYQPTKRKPKTSRPSAEGAGTGETGEEFGSTKKIKKPRLSTEPIGLPMASDSERPSFVAPQSPLVESTPIEPAESQSRSTIPETQASSGFGAPDSLVAAMHEQVARSEAAPSLFETRTAPEQMATAQSSSSITLPGGSVQTPSLSHNEPHLPKTEQPI